jgi:hypothetical protein
MYIREPLIHDVNEYQAQTNPDTDVAVIGGLPAGFGPDHISFVDDFIGNPASNVPPGGWVLVTDAGATVTAHATDLFPGGVLAITSDGTAEGVALYLPKCMQIGTREWFIEARVQTPDADDTDVQIGMSVLNATTNPEDLYTTASTDVIAFGVLDGDATVKSLIDKNNGGTSAVTGTIDLDNATWHTLGIRGKGTEWTDFYVDGVKSHRDVVSATVPDDVNMAPFFAARTGGDAGHIILVDWFRFGIAR